MNLNKIAAAAILTSTAATVTYVMLAEKRIHDLENELRRKEAVKNVWKRNFERAADHMTAAQLLVILDDMKIDSKFEKITLDI